MNIAPISPARPALARPQVALKPQAVKPAAAQAVKAQSSKSWTGFLIPLGMIGGLMAMPVLAKTAVGRFASLMPLVGVMVGSMIGSIVRGD